MPPPTGPLDPDNPVCRDCPHPRLEHQRAHFHPAPVPKFQPPYSVQVEASDGCTKCDCPSFANADQFQARFWTLGSVVDRFGYAMRAEGITAEVARRVANRVLHGHPEDMHAVFELDDRSRFQGGPVILTDEQRKEFLHGKWDKLDGS
jgi:hypothetical protein